MRRRRTTVVLASRIEYLDCGNCNSAVGYYIVRGRRRQLRGHVDLSDCNRKIEWYFDDDPEGIAKIDKAISMLTEFREKFIAARRRKR
jgi:hypothetical protein